MTFTKIEGEISEVIRKPYNKLQLKLKEFVSMNTKAVKVNFRENEYAKPIYGYKSLYNAAKIFCGPVAVIMRNGEIYLVRTDM
jgi:hypothetical protein